jgi:hypothetical protein
VCSPKHTLIGLDMLNMFNTSFQPALIDLSLSFKLSNTLARSLLRLYNCSEGLQRGHIFTSVGLFIDRNIPQPANPFPIVFEDFGTLPPGHQHLMGTYLTSPSAVVHTFIRSYLVLILVAIFVVECECERISSSYLTTSVSSQRKAFSCSRRERALKATLEFCAAGTQLEGTLWNPLAKKLTEFAWLTRRTININTNVKP